MIDGLSALRAILSTSSMMIPVSALLDVVVGGLDQLQDVLDVLAHVARLRAVALGHRERDVQDLRERLRQQRLAASSRAEQQDVRLLQLDVVLVD